MWCQGNWLDSHVENLNNHREGEKMIIADLMTWQEDVKGLQGGETAHYLWIDATLRNECIVIVYSSPSKIHLWGRERGNNGEHFPQGESINNVKKQQGGTGSPKCQLPKLVATKGEGSQKSSKFCQRSLWMSPGGITSINYVLRQERALLSFQQDARVLWSLFSHIS